MSPATGSAESNRLRVGVISDTHGLLRPEARGFLVGCDYIVHGGDVGAPEILEVLARPRVEERGGVIYLNPGSCGPRRFTLPISVGEILVSADGARARWVNLGGA